MSAAASAPSALRRDAAATPPRRRRDLAECGTWAPRRWLTHSGKLNNRLCGYLQHLQALIAPDPPSRRLQRAELQISSVIRKSPNAR